MVFIPSCVSSPSSSSLLSPAIIPYIFGSTHITCAMTKKSDTKEKLENYIFIFVADLLSHWIFRRSINKLSTNSKEIMITFFYIFCSYSLYLFFFSSFYAHRPLFKVFHLLRPIRLCCRYLLFHQPEPFKNKVKKKTQTTQNKVKLNLIQIFIFFSFF